MSKATARRSELQRFLSKLKSGKAVAIPASDVSRAKLAAHISGETRPVEIDPDAWWELLNAHPPRWMTPEPPVVSDTPANGRPAPDGFNSGS